MDSKYPLFVKVIFRTLFVINGKKNDAIYSYYSYIALRLKISQMFCVTIQLIARFILIR